MAVVGYAKFCKTSTFAVGIRTIPPENSIPNVFNISTPHWSFLGFSFHLATALLVLAALGMRPIAVLTAVACVLYIPTLLWSIGGLETPIAVFAVVALVLFYLDRGPTELLFWFLFGAMIWLRRFFA